MNLGNSLKKLGIEQTFKYVYKDPEPNMRKLMDWADRFAGDYFPGQRKVIREAIENPKHPYHDYILHLFRDIDQNVMTKLVTNFFVNASLIGWKSFARNITATFHGRSCSIPPVPVTCTAPDAGPPNTETS